MPATARYTPARSLPKSEVSRERVLEAAAQIFSERGYAGATMRDIAQAAGLQAGSLYYYFPSKELLIEAVIDKGIHGVSTSVYEAIANLPPSSTYNDRIRAAIVAHLQSILTYGAYASLSRRLLAQLPEDVLRKHVVRRDAYSNFWYKLLRSASEAGEVRDDLDLRVARLFLLGAMNSALDWYRPGGKSIEELADDFTRMLETGLLAPGRDA